MELDPVKIFYGLKARKFLILFMGLGFAAIAAVLSLKLPKSYEARAIVQVDSVQKNTLTGRIEHSARVAEFLGQQAAIAQSRTVALVVIDQLVEEGFFSMTDFEATWRERTGGETIAGNDARLWAADQILSRLTVTGDALASSLNFSFVSNDPSHSAKLANAFANGYMLTVLSQRQRRSARNARKFSDETTALAADVKDAKQALSDYRAESGIVGLGEARLEAAEVELSALTSRLGDARADFSEAQSMWRQVQGLTPEDLLNLPLPQENLPGRQAQVRLGAIMIQLNRVIQRYGENYPDYFELSREKENLEASIMESVKNRFEFAKRRLRELEEATEEHKLVVLELQERKQTFDDLEQNVDSRRGTFELINARSLQESLQSRIDVVEVLLLSRAVPANKPTLPAMPILVFVGAIMGLGLGLVIAFIVELMGRKVRVASTVQKILQVPVLAELPMDERESTKWRRAA